MELTKAIEKMNLHKILLIHTDGAKSENVRALDKLLDIAKQTQRKAGDRDDS